MMDGQGKSDRLIVPKKATNKPGELGAEALEGRGLAKGNLRQRDTDRTQSRESVSSALERVRQAAQREIGAGQPSASIMTPLLRAAWRHDPRQEPGAVVPHAGICGGGAPQGASLLRPLRDEATRTNGHDHEN